MARKSQIILLSLMLQYFVHSCLSDCSDGPYFDKITFHELKGTSIQTTAILHDFQCFMNCGSLPECLSLNVADAPNKDGLYECVLLRNMTSKSLGLLRPSHVYHHHTRRFVDKCATLRCMNGGTCETLTVDDFRCHCLQRFMGKQCDELSCNTSSPLGMKSGAIPDARITASSEHDSRYLAALGRLDMRPNSDASKRGAWAAKYNNLNQWLQVDLGTVTKVTDVATQGSPYKTHQEWVKSYSLQYSLTDTHFADYEGGKIFTGNNDKNTIVKNALKPAIIARYIRVRPKTWMPDITMRMELYGCK